MIQFSVVIAVYNKEEFLQKTLASVLDQSYPNFELIIINDGSTDDSEGVINSFSGDTRVSYYKQENQGAGAARNAGITKATKPYIALLDADDLWENNHLEVLAQLISQFPNNKIFATNSVVNNSGKIHHKSYSNLTDSTVQTVDFFKTSLIDSIVNSSTIVINKDVFDQTGNYNSSIVSGEDTDLFIRIGAKYPVVFTKHVTVTINRSKESLSNKSIPLENRLQLDKYPEIEAANRYAKVFFDLNRYSYSLEEKLTGETSNAKKLIAQIDLENLNKRQRTLLKLPTFALKGVYGFKKLLESLGLRISAFK